VATQDSPDNTPNSAPLYVGEPHPCPYLPGRTARDVFLTESELDPAAYEALMDCGFRRSGTVVYRPICDGCRECVQLRVPVAAFCLSRSQRRVLRRNLDVRVEIGTPVCTDEKWRIFVRYLRHQHDGTMSEDREAFERFLYGSPTRTLEMVYRLGRRIVGVGLVDVCPSALSSVYFFFEPKEARRSLGVFGALREIDECRNRGPPYWYAGFFVRDCTRMNYKAAFRPFELLGSDGQWRRFSRAEEVGRNGAGETP